MDDLDCIVLCSGKCGSSTLFITLTQNNFKNIKVHNKFDFIIQYNYDGLIETINKSSKNKKLYLFDIYRNPIERKISSFFHHINYINDRNYRNYSIEELINIFNNEYINTIEEYHSMNEILDEFKLENFKCFDFDRRYNIIEKDNLVFIKLLFKDINIWELKLSEIFRKKITLYNDNISENKEYHDVYVEFKKKYKVPKSYIDNILINDKEFKIYNTEEEQNIYIDRCHRELFFE